MKNLPACITCVKSGFLCKKCQKKYDQGEITDFEISLANDLIQLELEEEKFEYLKNVSFYKAIDYEDVVLLLVGQKDKLKITQDLINRIRELYEIDKIILIEKSKDPRAVLESLITPGKLISLNEIFLATGDTEFKAIVRKADVENGLFTVEELEELIIELTGNETRIEVQ